MTGVPACVLGQAATHELRLALEDTHKLFQEYARTGCLTTRERLIILHIGLASRLARRFAGYADQIDDLVQVGYIGLIKAIDRYDPERGVEFASYATPTIVGEIKRYFRDKGYPVRIPRQYRDARKVIDRVVDILTQRLQRAPIPSEVATAVKLPLADVALVSTLSLAGAMVSLDLETEHDDDCQINPMLDMLGREDEDIARLEDRCIIEDALQDLPARERTILFMRFYQQLTQSQVASALNISQMHVSRLERAALAKLRCHLAA
jgi:RNA polymerase sigma-B factor